VAGAGAYYAFGRPITEVQPQAWVEPKHDTMPEVKIFIKPDDPPVKTVITDFQTGQVLSAPTYKPGSFMDRYIKKRGFPPGF
jgi:hypothetical protein